MPAIHPTAIISPSARLHDRVTVGPYCVLGPEVELEEGNVLENHVVIQGRTRLGANNHLFPFVSLGLPPQDLTHHHQATTLIIGSNNLFRESVVVHAGTPRSAHGTVIGSGCFLMAHSHVGHDCLIGDGVILTNHATLAGHVQVADRAVISGLVGIHQFVRIGRLAMVAAGAMVSQDVPPFCLAQGDRARLRGLNTIGLRRSGMAPSTRLALRQAYHRLLLQPGLLKERLASLDTTLLGHPEVVELKTFLETSHRGFCRASHPTDEVDS